MKFSQTKLDGVLQIQPSSVFEDFRGQYVELYNKSAMEAAGIALDFVEDDISVSSRHVLRGLHGDRRTWKLISCLSGRFYLVVVNNDSESPQYREWVSFTLSEDNRMQVLVPPNFANGHLVMSEQAIFHYKQSATYDRESQFTLMWNDPELDIWWPWSEPIISKRDSGLE